VSNEDLIKLIG